MYKALVIGAGRIGTMAASLLVESGDYAVTLIDRDFTSASFKRFAEQKPGWDSMVLDISRPNELDRFIQSKPQDLVISCLPYHQTLQVAQAARRHGLHYFDLTEDTKTTATITELASGAGTAFVPQCGLAPGYVGIIANHLAQGFEVIDTIKLRVGALPQHASNPLHYALTWSVDGVINEYANPCFGIADGQQVVLPPMQNKETICIQGTSYEAFNTSGGLGSLADIYLGKVQHLNYKTIRYPGHCDQMRLLLFDLRLNNDRPTLKKVLENALPATLQDQVVIYVSVTGKENCHWLERSHAQVVFPSEIGGHHWTAIQITTAASACAIVDLVMSNPQDYQGLVYQEQFALNDVWNNRFGQYLKQKEHHHA